MPATGIFGILLVQHRLENMKAGVFCNVNSFIYVIFAPNLEILFLLCL